MKIKDFAKEAAGILPRIHTELVRRNPNELMKGKITFAQMIILDILRTGGESKMTDLSMVLGVTKSAVTGMTDRLIKAGLIRRSRSRRDRRIVKIRTTPKGARLAKRLYNFKIKVISAVFSNINQRERSQYLGILKRLEKNLSLRKRKTSHA